MTMKNLLIILCYLIALTCGMRNWSFNLPPRLEIYDVFVILFICGSLIYELTQDRRILLKADLKIYLVLLYILLLIGIISGFKILKSYDIEGSFDQYVKAVLSNGIFVIFSTFFVIFLSRLSNDRRCQVLKYYIYGVLLSSIYGVAGTILYKTTGLRIEAYIWDYISYNSGQRFDEPLTWTVMGIRRGIGFPGVAAGAAYNMTILPLLLLFALYRGKLKDYLYLFVCFAGFIVTLSRTGIASLVIALTVLTFLSLKIHRKSVVRIVLVLIPILAVGFIARHYISEISLYRSIKDVSRLMQWESGLQIFYENPIMGVGMNNFSVARNFLGASFYHDANLHNSWLTLLVELGIVGFSCYAGLLVFMLRKTFVRNDVLYKGFVSAIVGLSVGALGNQMFDLFYFKFFITLMFSLVILNPQSTFDTSGILKSLHNRLHCGDNPGKQSFAENGSKFPIAQKQGPIMIQDL